MVASDVGQTGRHHPHTTALVSWDSERSWSLAPDNEEDSTQCHSERGSKRHWDNLCHNSGCGNSLMCEGPQ
jgi:hypothetical protein